MIKKVIPVILAGGGGTRLWPMSRELYPKQFFKFDESLSLFQLAVKRGVFIVSSLGMKKKIIVVTNEDYRFIVVDQLKEFPDIQYDLFLEPTKKNTAPSLTLAALHMEQTCSGNLLLALPSDQVIENDLSFTNIDILYGYRKTETYGLGAVLLHSLFNIRFDIGYFSTQDMNDSTDFIQRESINTPTFYDSLHFSYPLKEKSDYIQKTFQIESELPFNINLIAQYFTHDTLSYSSDSLPVDQEINIPNLEIDPDEMTPSNFFTPGLGVPLAFITNKAMDMSKPMTITSKNPTVAITTKMRTITR